VIVNHASFCCDRCHGATLTSRYVNSLQPAVELRTSQASEIVKAVSPSGFSPASPVRPVRPTNKDKKYCTRTGVLRSRGVAQDLSVNDSWLSETDCHLCKVCDSVCSRRMNHTAGDRVDEPAAANSPIPLQRSHSACVSTPTQVSKRRSNCGRYSIS
jgi:hypothetical protein